MAQAFRWDPWSMAAVAPNRPAVIDDEATYTFGTLTARAERLGRGLRRLGVAEGDVVATSLPASGRLFALALAALRYGYGLFPVRPDLLGTPAGAALLGQAGVCLHVGPRPSGLVPDAREETLLGAATRPAPRLVPDNEPRAGFLVVAASAGTGAPRAVVRSRPDHPYRGVTVRDRYGAGPDRGAHIMANPALRLGTLGPALYALQAGSPVVVQQPWSARGFLSLVDRYRADSAFLSVDRAIDLAGTARRPTHRPLVLFHGGAACAPAVKRALIDRFGPVLHEFYGVSAGTVTEITTPEWLRRPGSVGRPVPGVRVRVARADGTGDVPVGEVGEVLVRHADSGDELRTGDLGHLDPAGYLYLVGRVTPGRAGWPQSRLEHAVRALPEVLDDIVCPEYPPEVLARPRPRQHRADADGVVVCRVETRTPVDPALAARICRMAREFGVTRFRVELHPPASLPRTESGRLSRTAPSGV